MDKQKVLVLGGGYASIAFLRSVLSSTLSSYDFTLITKNPYHYESVLLHEVASGFCDATDSNKSISHAYKDILPQGVNVIEDKVLEVKSGQVVCEGDTYNYDFVIVGLGFESEDFGIEGLREHALTLHDLESAKNIYQSVMDMLINFTPTLSLPNPRIVVCGAGLTGIELLGMLSERLPQISSKSVELYCVDASPRVLMPFDEISSRYAQKQLEAKGVTFELGVKITGFESGKVKFQKDGQSGELIGNVLIWTGGVKGSSVIANSPFFTSNKGRVEVDIYMQPINQENQELMSNVFVIGDCSALRDPTSGRFYPPTAQLAIAQGRYLSTTIDKYLRHTRKYLKYFDYHSKGSICSLGTKDAVGNVKGVHVKGYLAMLIKRASEKQWLNKLVDAIAKIRIT